MPRYRVTNNTRTRFYVPPPVDLFMVSGQQVVVNVPAAEMENPAIKNLVDRGLITLFASDDLGLDDHVEVPVLSMIGTVSGITPSDGEPVPVLKLTGTGGVQDTYSRSDHRHDVATAAAVEITDSTNGEGISTSLARADHKHAHGDRAGGSLHAVAVAGGAAGFMSGADKLVLDNILTFDAPTNVDKSAAVVGLATSAARADHKHDILTAAAVTLNAFSVNAEGAANTLARSNHTHNVATGSPTVGIGAGNAEGSSAFLARADHDHALRTSTGIDLTIGSIQDGQMVTRSGNTLVGANVPDTGITAAEHETLDTLVHELAENSFEEVSRNLNDEVDRITFWTNSGMTTKVRETLFTYNVNGDATLIVKIQYDATGTEVYRVTSTFARDGVGDVVSVSHVRT